MYEQIVGREKELKWITDSVDMMLTGKPSFRFLEGTVGIGKSSLLDLAKEHFVQKAPADNGVATYQCIVSNDTSDNLKAWASITTQMIMSEKPIIPEKQGFFKKFTDRKSLEVASEIMGVIPGADLASAAIKIFMTLKGDKDKPEDAENKFNKFTESPAEFYSDFVVSCSQKKPTLIILDDIQWINPASVSILSAILIKIINGKLKPMLCVLGAYRTAESSNQSSGLDSFDSFVNIIAKRYAKPDFVKVHQLAPLKKGDLVKIIDNELDKNCGLKEHELQWIADKSMGTPYMTKRIVEILKDNEIIHLDNGKYIFSDDLAFDGSKYEYSGNLLALIRDGIFDSYENSFAEGLKILAPEEIGILKYASVQGLNFESKALAATLGMTEEEILEKLYLLARKNLISSLKGGHFGFEAQRIFSFQTDAFCRVVNKQLFEPQKRIIAHKLATWFESEFDSKLSILINNLDCIDKTDFSQEAGVAQEKSLEEFASRAATYYTLADSPLSALQIYIKFTDHLFEEESFSIDKEAIHKRKKFFLFFQKIDQLLDAAKKDRNIELDLKQAMILEARASLVKGKMLRGLEIYSEAIQSLNYSAKVAGWTNQHALKLEILIARIHCYLLAGMFESARRLYPEMMQSIDALKHEQLTLKNIEMILDALRYDDELITKSILDVLITKFESYEDKTFLAKVIASKIRTKIWDNENECVEIFNRLAPVINSTNKASIFEILFIDIIQEIVSSNDMDDIACPYEEIYVNIGNITDIENALQRVTTAFTLLNRPDLFTPTDLTKLRCEYAYYLVFSRNSVSNFLIDVLKNPSTLEIDEKENVVDALTSMLEGDGILSKKKIAEAIDNVELNTLPATVKPRWCEMIDFAICINMFSDSKKNADYTRLSLNEYRDTNNKEKMINLMLSCAMQSDHNIYDLAIVDQEKINCVDEAERLLAECEPQLSKFDAINFRNQLGLCKCFQDDIDKGMEIFFKAMEMCIEISDYENFDGIYGHAEHFAKKAGKLPMYSKIKKLHKDMSQRVDDIEKTFSDNQEDYVEAEVLAGQLQEVADRKAQEDLDEALSLYNKALVLLEKAPYGKKDQDDLYEKMGDIYRLKLEDETTTQKEFDHAYSEMTRCYKKAYSINHELMDYGRMIELNKKIMNYSSEEDDWLETFHNTKYLALKNGNILEICELFEMIVPDFDTNFDPDENVDETEEDSSDVSNSLPTDKLKLFYDEVSQLFISKNLIELQNRAKAAIISYLLRIDEPLLAESIKNEA